MTLTSPSGAVTTYTYDNAHHKIGETDPRGNVSGVEAVTKEQFTSHWTYDRAGRVLTATDGLDHVTTTAYDPLGRVKTATAPNGGVTTYAYDANDNLTTETDAYGHVTTHTYDAAGNEVSTTAPDGAKTTSTYDGQGQLLTRTSPAGNVTGVDAETRRRNTTGYSYDAAGRVVQARTVDPNNTQLYLATSTTYDSQGHPVAVTDPTGAVTRTTYDAAGKVLSSTDPTGAVTRTGYDTLGRPTSTTTGGTTLTRTYDKAGQTVRAQTAGGAATTATYDLDGNPKTVTDPRGNASGATPAAFTTTFDYDVAGNRVKVTDPLGRATERTYYDAANQVSKVLDAAGQATNYGYDSVGNVINVTTPTGAVTAYSYNKIGQLKTVTTPLGGALTYTYDTAGRVKTATTAGGRVTSYAYTADGQPSTVTRPLGSIHYDYDVLDRPTRVDYSDTTPDLAFTYDAAGRVARASNGTTTAALAYDRAGRPTTIARGSQTSTYAWDSSGRLGKRTLPDGRSQSYSYNADAQPAGMDLTGPGTSRHITYGYDAAGNLTTIGRAGGPTTTRTVDAANQVTRLTHTASGGTPLVDQAITWSTTGDPSSVVTKRGTATSSALYTYDAAGRVAGICLPGSGTTCGATNPRTTYSYDANGNRISTATSNAPNIADNKTTTHAYDSDDRPTSDTVNGSVQTSYTYDANGSLTGQTGPAGIRSYTYGLDDNLYRAALEDGRVLTYGYDESGNRTSRSVNSTPDASWTWDTLDPLPTRLSERTGAGTATHQWWTDPTSELGTGDVDTVDPANPQWLLGDYQGSITDTAGATALTGSATLAPYGELLNSTGSGYATNPVRFHGQYQDNLTGLYDMRARDYSTTAGRFTAPDPVAAVAGTAYGNTYHYAYDRPATLSDPGGACPWCIGAAIGAAVGAVAGGVDCVKNHHSCAKSIATGALVGAAAGATMGLVGAAEVGVGATVAAEAAVGGVASVAYGAATAAYDERDYRIAAAGRDFATGATFAGAGAVTSRVLGPLVSRAAGKLVSRSPASRAVNVRAARAGRWLRSNQTGPKPADPSTVACPQLTGSAAEGAEGRLARVEDVLGGLGKGRQPSVRTVGSDGELQSVYDNLATGGSQIEVPGYKGSWIERPDGIRVGLRDVSKSGGRTIDVRLPDGRIYKVHVG